MRLEPQIGQLGVLGVVVMFFGLHSGIRQMVNGHVEPQFLAGCFHHSGQLQDRELFRELVEDAKFASLCRMQAGQFYAPHRVADIKKASRLPAATIDGNRMVDSSLHAEAVQRRAKNLIVIKAVDQQRVECDFIGHSPVNNSLVEVGRAQAPDFAAESDVVTVMDLGKMIKRPRLLGKWQDVFASIVLDLDEAFFNVDVWRSILAHGAKFHEMTIGLKFFDGKKHVQRSHNIIYLCEYRVLAVNHGIRRRALFGKVDNRFRFERFEYRTQKLIVADITNEGLDRFSGKALPGTKPIRKGSYSGQRHAAYFMVPEAA